MGGWVGGSYSKGLDVTATSWTDRQTDRQTRFNGNSLCDWHTANGQTKTDNFRPFLNFLLLFLSSVVPSFFNLSFLCLYPLSHCCSPAWFYFFSLRAFCSDFELPVGVTANQIH